MNKFKLLLVFFTINCIIWKVNGKNCSNIEKELVQTETEFLECVVHSYGNPDFIVCNNCYSKYSSLKVNFEKLKQNCSKTEDPFQTVLSVHTLLSNMWNQANCDDCQTNKSKEFGKLSTNFTNCIKNEPDNFCEGCRFLYENLKDLYMNIEKENENKVCYDMHFLMNKSRMSWSKLCQRQSDLFYFFIPAALVLCLTISFYSANIWITKRQERNHELLFNTDAEIRNRGNNIIENGHTATTEEQPNPIIEEEILAIDPPLKSSKILDISDDDSNYSDDDPILS